MKKFFLLSVLAFLSIAGFSQKCLTDYYYEQYQKAHPELKSDFEKLTHIQDYAPQQKTNAAVRIIPVVFHVIHEYGPENISKAQIEDAIRILNEDYRKLNPDTSDTRSIFKTHAADCSIEFRLAKIDPNGNCTEGINRIYSSLTNEATNAVKALSYWSNQKYMNIWVVKSIESSGSPGTILGYAQFPGGGAASTDGIVVRNDCLGRIGTQQGSPFGEYGRTLTHEVGHCLALFHTFQSGCNGGDQVGDTPPASAANYGCVLTTNSCNNFTSPYTSDVPDMLENYMDYTNGTCQSMFTNGQKTRMDAAILQYRSNLVSANNAAATGVDGSGPVGCAPVADFIAPKLVGCAGTNFSFTDFSYNGTITNWNWTFTGAATPNSTTQNPANIVWNTPGVYGVTLTVSNANGGNTKTRTSYITILPANAPDVIPVFQGFEGTSITTDGWTLENGGNSSTWQRITTSSKSGTACFRINHYNGTATDDVDAFYSKGYNLTGTVKPVLNFYTAYAQRATGVNDVLKLFVSTDCGQTWQSKISKAGGSLAGGVAMNSGNYIPQAADWVLQQLDLTQYVSKSNVRFRFETTSRQGNNIYVDDINIVDAKSGIQIYPDAASIDFNVTPNPFVNAANIQFHLAASSNVSLSIYDMLGKEINVYENQKAEAGIVKISVTDQMLEALHGGVFYATLHVNGVSYTKKFVRL